MLENCRSLIRTKIETEVYTRREQERFLPEQGEWIMDFRRVFMQAEVLDAYAELFSARFSRDWPFQVGGAEVAAIPLVAAIMLKMREKGKPVNAFFIRKSRKKTGLLKMVEGKITHDPVIFVDDLINRGGTFERQVLVAEEAQASVLAVFVVLRFRPLEYYTRLSEKGIRVENLFTLDDFRASIGTALLIRDEPNPPPTPFTIEWRFRAEYPLLELVTSKSGVAWDVDRIYFGTDQGTLFALRPSDGTVLWRYDLWPRAWLKRAKPGKEVFSTPVVCGERVYFGAADGNVYALDRNTGKKCWVSFAADWVYGELTVLSSASILMVPAAYGLKNRSGGIIGLDVATGKKKFEIGLPDRPTGICHAASRDQLYVGSHAGSVYSISVKDKRIVWSFRLLGTVAQAPVLSPMGDHLVVSSMEGSVYCLDPQTGAIQWRFDNGLANYASPLIWHNRVFVASLDKHLYALDLATGEKCWEWTARARLFASPRIYGGRLYLGGNDARLVEIDPANGRETGALQVTERITQPLQYDALHDQFYLITYANEIYTLRKGHSSPQKLKQ